MCFPDFLERRCIYPEPPPYVRVEGMILRARTEGIYRPTAVAICIQRASARGFPSILLVRHGEDTRWGFSQGGVLAGETLGQALVRELNEELAIEPVHVLGAYYLGPKKIKVGRNKSGFPHRLYLGCLVELAPEAKPEPDRFELSAVRREPLGESLGEVVALIGGYGSSEKRALLALWLHEVALLTL